MVYLPTQKGWRLEIGNKAMAQAAIILLIIGAAIAATVSLVDSALRMINFVKGDY